METRSDDRLIRSFNFLIPLFPWISTYAMPGFEVVGLHEVISIILIICFFVKKRRSVTVSEGSKWLLIFLYYSIFLSIVMLLTITSTDANDTLNRLLRNTLQIATIIILGEELFDYELFYKNMILLGIFFSLLLILQNVVFFTLSYEMPWLIPGFKLNYTIPEQSAYYSHYLGRYYHYGVSLRATGGFTEPTSYAAFALTVLSLILVFINNEHRLFYKYKRLSIVSAICISIALFISTSATGMIGLGAIAAITVGRILHKRNRTMFLLFPIFLIVLVGLWIYLGKNNSQIQNLMLRMSEVNVLSGNTSGNSRIIRGFAVWNELPIIYKILGTGFGNISYVIHQYSITTPYDMSYGSTYMNAIAEILVSTGIPGLLIMLSFFRACFRHRLMYYLEFYAIFALLMFSLNMLASASFVMFAVFLVNIESIPIINNEMDDDNAKIIG